jgi:hypothetical protein
VSTLVGRIAKQFNKSLLERDGKNAIQNSLLVMQEDTYLKNLFKLGIKSLHKNAVDEIIKKLHGELLLKVFHAKIANDVKDYKASKTKKPRPKRCPTMMLPMLAFVHHSSVHPKSSKPKTRNEKQMQIIETFKS